MFELQRTAANQQFYYVFSLIPRLETPFDYVNLKPCLLGYNPIKHIRVSAFVID